MYNTLKEIQEALSEKDLFKYAAKSENKTAEEIVEMLKKDNIDISLEAAKDCVNAIKNIDIVQNKELENVSGGCTSFSSGVPGPNGNQKYVVVTILNNCPLNKYTTERYKRPYCGNCSDSFKVNGETMYCGERWKGHNSIYVINYGNEIDARFVNDSEGVPA